jgi:hypothetical protein
LTPTILQLFDGIDIIGIITMPCFIHYGRQADGVKYTILLTLLESTSRDFRLTHEKMLSDTVLYDDIMAIKAWLMDDTGA